MNVVITGVAGLLGSNFAEYLLMRKSFLGIDNVIGIDNLSGGYREHLHLDDPNFIFLERDLTNPEDQKVIEEHFVKYPVTYVFHFAAYAAEGLSPFIRQFNYTSNIIPTAFLVNMSIKYNIKRFVFTSSMAVYGRNEVPFTENLIPNPIDSYGIAKYACEMDLAAAFEQHNLEYTIIRPHNVYGKYQNIWDPYRNVIGIWMYQATQGLPFTIYGDGEQTRAFSYIDDSLPCLWNAAVYPKAKNQIINLGGKRHTSLNEVAKIVSDVTGKNDIVHLEPRHEVKHAWSSYEKSEEILDYTENTSLERGIKLMWEWVKMTPERERIFWKQYELDKNIYSYW